MKRYGIKKIEDKKKKYVSDYAHLMEEWDWEKNGEAFVHWAGICRLKQNLKNC